MSTVAGTCQACNMRFASLDEMRQHYTTDFHIANVRARVEGQAKISAAEFRRRNVEDDNKKPIFNCKLCKKQFHSVQTLQSHVKSTEHLMRKEQRIIERDSTAGSALTSTSLGSAALGLHRRYRAHMRARLRAKEAEVAGASLNDVEGSNGDVKAAKPKVSFEDREADVTEARCLFCGHPNKTMKKNLKHMLEVHEFSVPLEHRVKDMRTLLQYLSRKVNGLMCLVCGESTKRYESLEALRAHMAAANHERLVLTSEYADFYEGAIDDGEAAVVKGLMDDGAGALVVRDDKRRRVIKRDRTLAVGMLRRVHETVVQREQRHMITAAGTAETQLMLKERRQETQAERTKHFKVLNKHHQIHMQYMLRLNVKKLWKKGYDGEGEMS